MNVVINIEKILDWVFHPRSFDHLFTYLFIHLLKTQQIKSTVFFLTQALNYRNEPVNFHVHSTPSGCRCLEILRMLQWTLLGLRDLRFVSEDQRWNESRFDSFNTKIRDPGYLARVFSLWQLNTFGR